MDEPNCTPTAHDVARFPEDSASSLSELRWKAGSEVPPFVSSNASVVQLLKDLNDGIIESVPQIVVSEAVAVQVYRLIYDKHARSAAFKGVAAHGLYTMLASLAHGVRTEPPDRDAAESLRKMLGRPIFRDRAEGGLAITFSNAAIQRRHDPELRDASLEEAHRRLLLRLDSRRLDFPFGEPPLSAAVAAGASGGGGGGGGGHGASAAASNAPRASLADLDARTRVLVHAHRILRLVCSSIRHRDLDETNHFVCANGFVFKFSRFV